MRTAKPPNRLYLHYVGETVSLFGDGMMRKLEIRNIREDGYYELFNKDKLVITASRCHLLADIK